MDWKNNISRYTIHIILAVALIISLFSVYYTYDSNQTDLNLNKVIFGTYKDVCVLHCKANGFYTGTTEMYSLCPNGQPKLDVCFCREEDLDTYTKLNLDTRDCTIAGNLKMDNESLDNLTNNLTGGVD